MVSFWSVLLYFFIPAALLLLAIILFCHGALQSLNDWAMLLVGRLIFARFNTLPFPLIVGVLGIHVLTAVIQGTSVYTFHQSHPPLGPGAQWDTVKYHSKMWRQQRNLYLVCLSLVLWWSPHSPTPPYTAAARRGKDTQRTQEGWEAEMGESLTGISLCAAPAVCGVRCAVSCAVCRRMLYSVYSLKVQLDRANKLVELQKSKAK